MYRNYGEMGNHSAEFSAERKIHPRERLKTLMAEISGSLNREAQQSYGIDNLLDKECQVQISGYEQVYEPNLINQSLAEIRQRELDFSGAINPRVQENYKIQYNIEGQEAIIQKWKENKKKEKNTQMEMAVTALLYKVLGDRYFVVRTSEYDDYHNGIDNIIIDKQTGAVVCAFDEVHEGGMGDRTQKKQDKIIKTAKKGGAKLRFGLSMEGGKLKRSKQENLPVFYLGLNTDELVSLTENMNYELDKGLSEQEKLTFSKLLRSVREQFVSLSNEQLPKEVKTNLGRFEESLAGIEQYSKDFVNR